MLPVEQLWHLCRKWPMPMVAQKIDLTPAELVVRFQTAGLMGNGPKDPSPEEIKRATLDLQSEWTPEVRQGRWVGKRGRQIR